MTLSITRNGILSFRHHSHFEVQEMRAAGSKANFILHIFKLHIRTFGTLVDILIL